MQVLDINNAYHLLTILSSAVILTLSFLLYSIQLPQQRIYAKFSNARLLLSLSYLILGVSGIISSFLPQAGTELTLLLLITAIVASFQSLLFTATHIVFIQPGTLHRKSVILQIVIITVSAAILSIVYHQKVLNGSVFSVIIILLYLSQQLYYTLQFRKLHRRCVEQMESYYDEEQYHRLQWVYYSFFSALIVGLLSIVSSVSGLACYSVFIVVYTLFYTYMVVLIYNNKLFTSIILPAVIDSKPSEPAPIPAQALYDETDESYIDSEEYRQQFKEQLTVWMKHKGYLQKDLSVDEIAQKLNTSRAYLRYYFRTYIHSDFRTWRSELRIAEAKNIMRAHPDMTLSAIAEKVGFNHRANFFNQFLKIEGMTPTEWRKAQEA